MNRNQKLINTWTISTFIRESIIANPSSPHSLLYVSLVFVITSFFTLNFFQRYIASNKFMAIWYVAIQNTFQVRFINFKLLEWYFVTSIYCEWTFFYFAVIRKAELNFSNDHYPVVMNRSLKFIALTWSLGQ